jgi:hypothetical protein
VRFKHRRLIDIRVKLKAPILRVPGLGKDGWLEVVLGDLSLSTVVPAATPQPEEEESYERYVLRITDVEARIFRDEDWYHPLVPAFGVQVPPPSPLHPRVRLSSRRRA